MLILKPTQLLINYTNNNSCTTSKLYPIPLLHLRSQFLSTTTYIPLLRCCYGGNKIDYFSVKLIAKIPNSWRKKQKWGGIGLNVTAANARETPYQVLGVSSNATPNQIKRAYRKLALKYHPDVNKQPDAQEKFMRIKHAYNTLISSGSRTRYDSDASYSSAERNRSSKQKDEEEFYGFGDFFKDLQEEFQNLEASASSQGKPKSLWEELADIGEEFVEFLEKELNITDDDDEQSRRDSFSSFEGQRRNDVEGAGIKESIDEIEASLAKLKKELGL